MPGEQMPLFPNEPSERPYVTVAQVGDIPEGQGRAFAVGKRMVAVFLHQGRYYAIDDFCPHQGASLAEGYLEDCAVACPLHHWRFSIENGSWLDNPKIQIETYNVRVSNGKIQVQQAEEKPEG